MRDFRSWLWRTAEAWTRIRRGAKGALPWVRRRQYRKLERKYAQLVDAVHRGLPAAADASIEVRKSPGGLDGRVCLFVTHAPRAALKSHVVHHLEHLLGAGLQIVLIVNTDLPFAQIQIAPD